MYSLRRKRKERASDDKGPKRGSTETKGAPALHIPQFPCGRMEGASVRGRKSCNVVDQCSGMEMT